jgi:hypothetical protein
MKPNLRIFVTFIFLLFLFVGNNSFSQGYVGEVTRADTRSYIERGSQPASSEIEPIIKSDEDAQDILLNDKLSSEDGIVQLSLDDANLTDIVMLQDASLKVTKVEEELFCNVTGIVLFSRTPAKEPAATCNAFAGGVNFKHNDTMFLLNARGYETSLFVMEGSVEVSSAEPELSEKVIVNAGEWLVTRKGEPIPKPKKYRRIDVVSGNNECIYSWCRLTRGVIIEPPYRPVLSPPPPNPPGHR